MSEPESEKTNDPVADRIYMVGADSSASDLIDVTGIEQSVLNEINDLMRALARLRQREQVLSDASQRYMNLGPQEMRALHYLMVAKRQKQIVTPGAISSYLRISAASTTKLLNRLEQGNHITRRLHPTDRRALAIEITPETEVSARQTVGQLHARRFHAAARLSSSEREVVTRFLNDMADELDVRQADWASDLTDTHSGQDT